MAFQNRTANHRIAANICQAIMCRVVKKPGGRGGFPPRRPISIGMAPLPLGWQKLQLTTASRQRNVQAPQARKAQLNANPLRIPSGNLGTNTLHTVLLS